MIVAPSYSGFWKAPAAGGGGASASIIFADGMEMSSASLKWKGGGNATRTTGISGANGAVYSNTSASSIVAFGQNLQTVSAGMRFQVRTDATGILLRFADGTANHFEVRYVAGGAIRAARNGTTLSTSASGLINLNVWMRVEAAVTIDDTTGSYTINLTDDSEALVTTLTATGQDTRDGGAGAFASKLEAGSTACNTLIEDAWIDEDGNLHGPCQIETLAPTGAGDLTQWTPGAGSNWAQVDELPWDGNTSFVKSTAADQYDFYAFANRGVTGTPLAVQLSANADFLSAGTRRFKLCVRIGGVTYEGATTHTVTSAYLIYSEVWNLNPATSAAWTDSDIDGAQFGYRSLDTDVVITQLMAEIVVQLP